MKTLKTILQSDILKLAVIIFIFSFIFFETPLFFIISVLLSLIFLRKKIIYILLTPLLIALLYFIIFFQISILSVSSISDSSEIEVTVDKNLNINDFTSFETTYHRKKYQVTIFSPLDIQYGDSLILQNVDQKLIDNKYFNEHSFDYRQYMHSKSIHYQLSSSDYEIVNNKKTPLQNLKNLRLQIIKDLESKYPKNYIFINSIVLGFDDYTENFETMLIKSGLLHVFSISGTHVIILLEITSLITRKFSLKVQTTEYITLFIILLLYIMGGMQIPLARAAFCEITYLLFSKNIKKLSLSRAYFLILFFLNPTIIFNPSYQLTFLSTELVYQFSNRKIFFPFYMFLYMLPLTLNISYGINILSPFFGFIIEFIVCTLLLPLGICMIILPKLPFLGLIFYILSCIIYIFIYFLSDFFIITGEGSTFLLFFLCLTFFFKKNSLRISMCAFILTLILCNFNLVGKISFIDVGQGDCTLIQFPLNKETILIDTGNDFAKDEVINELKALGIKNIDHLFLTHDHADHNINVNSLEDVFEIKNIYTSNFDDHIQKYKVETNVQAGDIISLDNQNIKILYPYFENENANSESLAFTITLGGNTFFFGGDIEKKDELVIIENNQSLDIDYLQVNHHGSQTSSLNEFIETTSPSHAIISSGRNNLYNHPAPVTINTLEEYNIDILDTQQEGEIIYYFYKEKLWRKNNDKTFN